MLGGFINTIKPYNNEKFDQILFINEDIIDIIDNNIAQVIRLNQISGTEYREKKEEIKKILDNLNIFISDKIHLQRIEYIQDLGKFKQNLKPIIKFLPELRQNKSILLDINCHIKNKKDTCPIFNPDSSNKLAEHITSYINNSFSLLNYKKKFEEYKIDKYLIVKRHNDNYYILYQHNINYKLETMPIIYEILDNLSLQILDPQIINKTQLKFNYATFNKKIIYTKTKNIIVGKIYHNNFIKLINDMIKTKNHQELIFDIRKILDKLYRFNKSTNAYIDNVFVYINNPILFLMFINEFDILINLLDKDKINMSDLLEYFPLSDKLSYYYNYYYYLGLTYGKNIKLEEIKKFINLSEPELYQKFLDEMYEIIQILFKIKNDYKDSNFVKGILLNFMNNILKFNDNQYFPINIRLLLEKFTTPVEIDDANVIKYIEMLDDIDKYYNNREIFKILNSTQYVQYQDETYPDCGENTIFNLLNYLLISKFNEEFIITNEFNFEKIINTEFEPFYRKYNNYENLIERYDENSHVKSEFASILSGKKINVYNRKEICEIIPTQENVLIIMNHIFNKTFKNLKEFIQYFDINHSLSEVDSDEYILDNILKVKLSRHHGSIDIINKNIGKEYNFYNIMYDSKQNIQSIDELDKKKQLLLYTDYLNDNGDNIIKMTINDIEITDDTCIILLDNYKMNNYMIYLYTKFAIYKKRLKLAKFLIEKIRNQLNDLEIQNDRQLELNLFLNHHSDSKSILENAILVENIEYVKLVLDADPNLDINRNDEISEYTLYKTENRDILKLLITEFIKKKRKEDGDGDGNVNPNISNITGTKPLIFKVCHDYDLVKLLIENGATTVYTDGYDKEHSLLNHIVSFGEFGESDIKKQEQIKITKLLIEHYKKNGLGIDYLSFDETPLMSAIKNIKDDDKIEIIKLLIDNGAKLDNAIHYAIRSANTNQNESDNLNIIKLLVDSGAPINFVDKTNTVPLVLAIEYGYISIIKYLIENGANVNFSVYKPIMYDDGSHINFTPIYAALQNGYEHNQYNYDIVKILLDANADINTQLYNGYPIMYYTICNYLHHIDEPKYVNTQYILDIIKLLILKKADINWQNTDGITYINTIIMRKCDDISSKVELRSAKKVSDLLVLLIKNGANINIPLENPPIINAIMYSENSGPLYIKKIIKILISNNALIDIDTRHGIPLELSKKYDLYDYIKSIASDKNYSELNKEMKGGYYYKYIKYKQKYLDYKKLINHKKTII